MFRLLVTYLPSLLFLTKDFLFFFLSSAFLAKDGTSSFYVLFQVIKKNLFSLTNLETIKFVTQNFLSQ